MLIQKHSVKIFFLCAVLVIGMITAAVSIPTSLPADSDFQAIYAASLALRHGTPIYELESVSAIAAHELDIPQEKFSLIPFLYPPWYVLFAWYLGFFPLRMAATLWFEVNLCMFFLSVWLLTDGWNGRARLFIFLPALLFPPVLGGAVVGQYNFPVLLGGSLLMYAFRREKASLAALGMMFLTFKPHLGGLLFLFVLIWLSLQATDFGQRALVFSFVAMAFLFCLGFFADPQWMSSYPLILVGGQNTYNVEACTRLCANLPFFISSGLFNGSLFDAMLIAATLLFLLGGALFIQRRKLMREPSLLSNSALLVTLLVSPYLFNYDYILLLIPFLTLPGRTQNKLYKTALLACYLVCITAFLIWERGGNFSLVAASALVAGIFYMRLQEMNSQRKDLPANAS